MTDCEMCVGRSICIAIGFITSAQAVKNCRHFKDVRRFVELPFAIGDTVFSITQRSDTKKFCVRRATITVRNAMHYRKIYYENLLYLTRSDADSMVHELNALEKHSD